MIRINSLLAAAAMAAALGIAAVPASASQVAVDDDVLRFTAAPGESNDALVVPNDEGGLLVADSGSGPAVPGEGCEQADGFALCQDARAVVVALGDQDDVASIDSYVLAPATIDGGDGADSVSAGGGPTLVRGGAGDDFLNGGGANDSIDPGAGMDYVIAGAGDDTIAARDGAEDAIACGDGDDTVSADPGDSVDEDCERVSTGGPAPALADPTVSGGPSDPGVIDPTRAEQTLCVPKRRWISCAVRLRDPRVSGRFDATLARGSVNYARGRGRVVAGTFRVRMRTRAPLVSGTYKLRVNVRPTSGSPFRRAWRVGVLAFGR